MARTKPSGRGTTTASDLNGLDHHLHQQRARAGRLWDHEDRWPWSCPDRLVWRRYQATDPQANTLTSLAAHRAWSDAVEEAITTAEKISWQRPGDLIELLIQFEAIWWWVVEDDSILDGSARRWLNRFRRSLRRLADGRLI